MTDREDLHGTSYKRYGTMMVPHTKLVEIKGHQNWAKVSRGKCSRVVLDVGYGVVDFGGYLSYRDVLIMSFAQKMSMKPKCQLQLMGKFQVYLSV